MEYSDNCITTVRMYCEKGGYYGKQTCIVNIRKAILSWRCIFQMDGLDIWQVVYTGYIQLKQDNIFCTTIGGLIITGIQEEIL